MIPRTITHKRSVMIRQLHCSKFLKQKEETKERTEKAENSLPGRRMEDSLIDERDNEREPNSSVSSQILHCAPSHLQPRPFYCLSVN